MSIDERFDPVELLGAYTAPAGWNRPVELTGPETDHAAVALLERVVDGRLTAIGPRRRHLRLVTGVIVAVSLGGAAVAAAAFLSRQPDDPQSLACWSGPTAPPAAKVAVGWDGLIDPIQLCTDEWQGGDLGDDGPPEPLQACVNDVGVAAVVPGDDATCDRLGFARFAAADPSMPDGEQLLAVAELEQRFAVQYNTDTCRDDRDVVVAEVRSLLDELGLIDWSVTIAGTSSADEPCASASVDPDVDTVFIVPRPRGG